MAKLEGDALTVSVGSAEHFIQWICVQTDRGGRRKTLQPGRAPGITFRPGGDKAVAVYAYCNLHGL